MLVLRLRYMSYFPLKPFKGFNILKISLKTLLKTIKDNFFKDREFFKFLLLKNKNLLISETAQNLKTKTL
jgi:hypothetical protein